MDNINQVNDGHIKDSLRVQKIRNYQLKHIQKMLRYAYENVPLYRAKYDAAGIKPEDIRSLSDFKSVPLLTKRELQTGFPDDILSNKVNPNHCYVVSTSGHSGSPVKLYRSKAELYYLTFISILCMPLLPWLMKAITGIKTGNRYSAIMIMDDSYDLYRIVKNILKYPRFTHSNLQFINAEAEVSKQYRELVRHKPDIISSNLSVFKNLIAYAHRNGLDIPKVKLLYVGSELIDESSRKLLQNAFDATIFEHYGSEEAGTIATECPCENGLHISWRVNYVEILNDRHDAAAGVPGQLVVTNFVEKATPIIRYTGMEDTATMSPLLCSCRRHAPMLKMIDGRIVDSFIMPDGRIIHPSSLAVPMEGIPGLWRYQIIQEKTDFVRVLLVNIDGQTGNDNLQQNTEVKQHILSFMKNILGDNIYVEINIVDDIPVAAGSRHKFHTVISLVNHENSI
jgi:phenylacetate-CoA ligase